ncbi:tail fiber domain-containing protein [Limosilactobacillus gorillae]|uniref:tail fiber domain-containing protein n=1 Tax=Limosilactobacillus gorillae TaxID=1450649 RepID=UPI000ABCC14C|nr:tail fiber domain-containing protein [Limosilactobacillus gorillae]
MAGKLINAKQLVDIIKKVDDKATNDNQSVAQMVIDMKSKIVDPAVKAADSTAITVDKLVKESSVIKQAQAATSQAIDEAKQGANDAMSRAKSAWDVATDAKSAVTDFDPLLKQAQSDAKAAGSSAAVLRTDMDKVTSLVNDPKTGLNATYQTAAGNATTISNVKSDVYQLETAATGLTSRVGNLESKSATQQTELNQTKAAIALKAEQADVDTLKGNVTGLQAESTTQASEIKNKVTRSDVTGMLTGYATQEYTQSLVTQKADEWNLNINNVKSSLTQSVTNLNASIDGIKADVYNKDGSSKVVQLSNLIATKVSSGDYNSQITQLKNDINLRVQKGGLLSQINLEAGRALIKSGNVVLSGDTVTFDTKEAFIPAAAISKLTADDISTGTLKGVKVDFRNSTGTGMIADGSTLTFDVSNTPAGDLSYNGMPVAEIPDGSGGNELAIRYGLSTAIIPNDNSEAQATFSKAAQKIAYMTGTDQGKQMLSGLEVHSNNHHWLGAVNSDATYNRLEINSNDGVNLTWHDQTHFWISDGKAKLYKDYNDSSTATKLEIHGWAWINGWCEAAGHSTHSTLSSKTDIRDFDTAEALKLIDETRLMTFRYKNEKDSGVLYDHYGPIIDDVHDVLKYQMPEAFISPTRTARDDSNIVGALMGAVQELHKQVKELQKKIGTTS